MPICAEDPRPPAQNPCLPARKFHGAHAEVPRHPCGKSESIRRILSPLKIRTCFRPHRTLRQALVNLKDWVPLQQKAGVIYRIPCSGCPRVYVGQTGRTLAQQLKEHKRALVNGHLAQSAVAEHAAQESHDIDWEGATVMNVQQQYHQRCLLESWHIRSELNTMNRDEGNLSPGYDLLIRQSHSPDHTFLLHDLSFI